MGSRLEEIAARLEAATPGPWRLGASGIAAVAGREYLVHTIRSDSDADLIVNAPADVAVLLAVVREVAALAEEWRYKGEFGWGAWQEGEGPDPEGWALDHAAGKIRDALAPLTKEETDAG